MEKVRTIFDWAFKHAWIVHAHTTKLPSYLALNALLNLCNTVLASDFTLSALLSQARRWYLDCHQINAFLMKMTLTVSNALHSGTFALARSAYLAWNVRLQNTLLLLMHIHGILELLRWCRCSYYSHLRVRCSVLLSLTWDTIDSCFFVWAVALWSTGWYDCLLGIDGGGGLWKLIGGLLWRSKIGITTWIAWVHTLR